MEKGTKVICIDDVFDVRSIKLIPNRPKKDLVYVIREIIEHKQVGNSVGILLNEIRNPDLEIKDGEMFEPTFSINRFIPLDWEINEDEFVKEKEYESENLL